MSHKRYDMDILLTQIQDRLMQTHHMNEEASMEWVRKCLTAFKAEALPHLRKISQLIPRYEFQVSLIEENCNDVAEATSMDYLKIVLIQMTNAFEHLFHVGTYTISDWDTDACIDSIVRYMTHQVQPSKQNRVATSTILALHFCSTFLKQMRLLCVRDMDRLVIYLQNNGFDLQTAEYIVSKLGILKTRALKGVSQNDLKSLTHLTAVDMRKLKNLIARYTLSTTNKDALLNLLGKLHEVDTERDRLMIDTL